MTNPQGNRRPMPALVKSGRFVVHNAPDTGAIAGMHAQLGGYRWRDSVRTTGQNGCHWDRRTLL